MGGGEQPPTACAERRPPEDAGARGPASPSSSGRSPLSPLGLARASPGCRALLAARRWSRAAKRFAHLVHPPLGPGNRSFRHAHGKLGAVPSRELPSARVEGCRTRNPQISHTSRAGRAHRVPKAAPQRPRRAQLLPAAVRALASRSSTGRPDGVQVGVWPQLGAARGRCSPQDHPHAGQVLSSAMPERSGREKHSARTRVEPRPHLSGKPSVKT